MEYTNIPGTDITCGRVALGTWAIGGWMWGGEDEVESIGAIHAALDKGVNVIDTAPVYGFGRSEEVVGKAVERHGGRDKIVLATKAGLDWTNEGVKRNSTRPRLRKELEDSLRRLRTDYIDLYQVHWPDPLVPFEETAAVLREFTEQGKILAIGVSNYSPEQMDQFQVAAPLNMCQPPYNIFEREIEGDVKPYCEQNTIGLITYGALCRGMLSGRMTRDREFTGDDLRKVDPKFQSPRFEQYLAAARELDAFAKDTYGKDLIQLAARFVLDKGAHIALWGARRPDQMAPLPGVFGWNLTDKDLQSIDKIVSRNVTDPVGPEFMAPPARA